MTLSSIRAKKVSSKSRSDKRKRPFCCHVIWSTVNRSIQQFRPQKHHRVQPLQHVQPKLLVLGVLLGHAKVLLGGGTSANRHLGPFEAISNSGTKK